MNDGARNALDAYLDKIVAEARADERKNIVTQVRNNCTPSSEAYARGGDFIVYAVADWIENPPEWVTGSGELSDDLQSDHSNESPARSTNSSTERQENR